MHIAAYMMATGKTIPALKRLRDAIAANSKKWAGVVKIGRTHLEDATPLTVGQEWSGYAGALDDATEEVEHAVTAPDSDTVSPVRERAVRDPATPFARPARSGQWKFWPMMSIDDISMAVTFDKAGDMGVFKQAELRAVAAVALTRPLFGGGDVAEAVARGG